MTATGRAPQRKGQAMTMTALVCVLQPPSKGGNR